MNNRPETRGCGGDFPQFYFAGTIVQPRRGGTVVRSAVLSPLSGVDARRSAPLALPADHGLAHGALARLSYDAALAAWWAIQAVCILATGVIFYRTSPLPRPWRINMLAALAALLPLWIAVGIGHLAPMLLLVLAGGLTLHKQGKRGWAGLVLSLLALKPQLAAGLVLWMLLRRDLRTLLGLAAGFALQALAVAVFLGPGLWLDYLHAMPAISAVTRAYRYSPLFEQSFAGIASNLLVGGRADGMASAGDEDRLRGHGQRGRGHALPRRLGAAGREQVAGRQLPAHRPPEPRITNMPAACCS